MSHHDTALTSTLQHLTAADTDFIYDIETYKNLFCVAIVHVRTRTRWIFEVSDRMNQSALFVQMIRWLAMIGARMVGFNNEGFDYPVIHHLIAISDRQGYFLAIDAYNKAQEIIGGQDRFGHMIWANDRIVPQVDLYKIHHFDNMARATSLKKLEIAMRSRSVVDLPYSPHADLTFEQMDEIIAYMCHDVSETLKFYHASHDQIAFRDDLAVKYPDLGDVINFNDTKIGKKYFERELELAIPGICYTRDPVTRRRTPRQTLRSTIALRDVVSPKVRFSTPGFQMILDRLNASVIVETKGVFEDMKATFNGIDFVFGTGGIHGSQHATSVYPDDEYDLVDVDVASYYPNLAISNGFFPAHLSEKFCDIYLDVYKMRKSYPKKTAENAMLKLALNGVYGDSGNGYSPFYDPQYMMSITINGQLFLCMLAEWVVAVGAKMVQVNTDGITCLVPKRSRQVFEETCARWEDHTGLELEHVDYSAMHIRDVNSYIAVKTDGSIKRIGAYGYVTPLEDPYTRERQWHKDHSALVVPKAAEAKLVHGTDIAEFIMAHRDPFDFMLSVKVPKTSRLEERWPDGSITPVQNVCRYYVATDGCALTKVMPPLKNKPGVERPIGVEKGWTVRTVNDADHFSWSNVNWLYYIEEAKKLTSWVS